MKLQEIKPISLLRLSFVTGILGYAIISLAPQEWGLLKAGLILTMLAAATFCLYLFKRWPGQWAKQSPIRWILCVCGFAALAMLAAGAIILSMISLFS